MISPAVAKGDERVWQEDLEVVTPYYGVDDVPPPLETLLYAWQHTLVDVSPYVLPLMVAGAVGYTAAQAAAMISACLTVMGLATFANATWGNRLPSVLGPSATDTGAMATAGAIYGAPAMWMAGFIGGLFEIVVGVSGVLVPLRRYLPPYVCGIVVLTIGISLARVAGGWVFANPDPTMLGLAGAAVLSIVVLTVIGHRLRFGILARGAIFFSLMLFGVLVAGLLGLADFSALERARWFGLPRLFAFGGPESRPLQGENLPLRGGTFPLVGGTVPLKGESRPLVGENLPLKGGNRPLRGGQVAGKGRTTAFMRLRTPLADLLGIEVPILQSGMGRVAGPELASEVSRAGGLGILAGLRLGADELRRQIRCLRELTDRPFGVNLWLHPDVETPVDAGMLPEALVEIVQDTLNRFREQMDLPARTERPAGMPDVVDEAFETILDERVPVFSIGLGDPGAERVRRCHERGIKVIAMAATVEDARALAASGVDAIVAQGGEAGGHRSTWVERKSPADVGTFALVPQVVDAVSMPVIAAGGIADGRGLLAALALGAAGVMLGTRFVATRESQAPEFWKRSLLERQSEETTLTNVFTGLHARAVRNTFADEYAASGAPLLPPLVQSNAAEDIYMAAAKRGDGEHFPQFAGQSLGLIHDLPGAAEVVERIVEEARAAMAKLPEGLRTSFR